MCKEKQHNLIRILILAIVGIGFYFVKRRALATGIAVAGAGIGTFVFAPFTTWLLETYGLRGTFAILVR